MCEDISKTSEAIVLLSALPTWHRCNNDKISHWQSMAPQRCNNDKIFQSWYNRVRRKSRRRRRRIITMRDAHSLTHSLIQWLTQSVTLTHAVGLTHPLTHPLTHAPRSRHRMTNISHSRHHIHIHWLAGIRHSFLGLTNANISRVQTHCLGYQSHLAWLLLLFVHIPVLWRHCQAVTCVCCEHLKHCLLAGSVCQPALAALT